MSDDLIARARALLAAATKGPWLVGKPWPGLHEAIWSPQDEDGLFSEVPAGDSDRALIAAAPTLLAELLDRLEAAEADLRKLTGMTRPTNGEAYGEGKRKGAAEERAAIVAWLSADREPAAYAYKDALAESISVGAHLAGKGDGRG